MNKKMKKPEELTWAEVKAMFAENERRFAENERRFAESQAKLDKLWAESRAEADRRQAEADKRQAEADKRQAEFDKRFAESQAAADKRKAEADKRQAEFDKRFAESQAAADKRKAEADKRHAALDAYINKVSKQIGGIDDNIGHHAEQFFQDTFTETLTFGGEKYENIYKNFQCSDRNGVGVEFDIVLVNGKSVAIIEVKNRIHPKFVKEMATEKVAKFRRFFPKYEKHKAYLGIAGFSFSQAVRDEAKKLGIGIIKQVGNSVEIDAGHLKTY